MIASRTPSEIWSQILSGCPSVTDSDVNRYSLSDRVLAFKVLGLRRLWLVDVEEQLGADPVVLAVNGEAHGGRVFEENRQFGESRILGQTERFDSAEELIEVEKD